MTDRDFGRFFSITFNFATWSHSFFPPSEGHGSRAKIEYDPLLVRQSQRYRSKSMTFSMKWTDWGGNFYNRVRLKTRTPKPNPNWKTRNWKPNLNALIAKDSTSRFRLKLMNYPGVQLICIDYWQSMSTWHRTACEKCRNSTIVATPSNGRYLLLHACRCTVSQCE